MSRRIAIYLLLFALLGNLGPMVLAAVAPQPHACCVRKTVHKCHDSGASGSVSDSERPVIRDGSCCNDNCCRALALPNWADARPRTSVIVLEIVDTRVVLPQLKLPRTASIEFRSTRAPPAL
jgi:hypothetical protein